MQALPFIEVVGNIHKENIGKYISADEVVGISSKIFKLQKFYSQPFAAGMVINFIQFPKYEIWAKYNSKFSKETKKYLRKEGKVLFELQNNKRINNTTIEQVRAMFPMQLCKTLNDFLTDCFKYLPTELHWKQSIVDKYFNNQTK